MGKLMPNKLVIDMDKRYFDYEEATQYVVDYIKDQGNSCFLKSEGIVTVLEIDGQEYSLRLSQRIWGPIPPQIAVVKKIEE